MTEIPRAPIAAPHSLGEAISLLQRRARLTREEFSRRSGLAEGTLANYLRDAAVPGAANLRRISAVLAESLDEDSERLWMELGRLLDAEAGPAPLAKAAYLLDEQGGPPKD